MKRILKFIDFVPHDTKIDFFGHRYYAFLTSLIILGGSVLAMSIYGLNFGIDFTGGTIIEIEAPSDPNIPELRTELNELHLGEVTLHEF